MYSPGGIAHFVKHQSKRIQRHKTVLGLIQNIDLVLNHVKKPNESIREEGCELVCDAQSSAVV